MYPYALFLDVHLYGVMIAVGLVLAVILLYALCKKKKIDSRFTDFVFLDGAISTALGFLSASLFQAVYNYIDDPTGGFNFEGGITFLGGMVGGSICFLFLYFLFGRNYKNKLSDVLSILPCCILLAHAFGRIGCFFAGCCYGAETDSVFGVQFPFLPSPVFPTQLYESAFLFILFGVCLTLLLKRDFKYNLSLYLIGYGIFRFFIEFIRGDKRGAFVIGLSPSQFWSVVMVILGVGIWLICAKNKKKAHTESV